MKKGDEEKSEDSVSVRIPLSLKKKMKVKAGKEGRTLSNWLKQLCFKAVKK